MLTVSEDERDLAAALRGGARGYLLKTVDSDALASAIVRTVAGESTISPEMTGKLVTAFQSLQPEAAGAAAAAAPPPTDPLASLSPREQQILAEIALRRQQQGDRAHAGHRRDHGEDPRAAHPAQAGPELARAGGGVRHARHGNGNGNSD